MEFESFKTIGDFFEAIDRTNRRGEEFYRRMPQHIKDALVPGCKYIHDCGEGFMVFGEVLPPQYDEDKRILERQPYLRIIKATSCVMFADDFDYGTDYASNMLPIHSDLYEVFEKLGWRTELSQEEIDEIYTADFCVKTCVAPYIEGYHYLLNYIKIIRRKG